MRKRDGCRGRMIENGREDERERGREREDNMRERETKGQ